MSSLYSQIQQDLNKALKDRDMVMATTLRTLFSEIKNFAIEKRKDVTELDDASVQQIISKQVKQRAESIEAFKQGGREDLVQKEQRELDILKKYLPQQLTDDELEKAIKEAIEETKASDIRQMGQVMAFLKQKYGAQIDMQKASQKVKDLLS